MPIPLELFCCSAREDQEMLESLRKHLMPLQRQGQITIWSNANIHAGMEWEKELHRHLESADIILLLISPDFMNSEYCYSTEMKRAIERSEQGSACVIPILLRPTFWRDAPFARLQVLPSNATPVTGWPDRDSAFHNITEHLTQVFPEILTRRAQVELEIQRILLAGKEVQAVPVKASAVSEEQREGRSQQKERPMSDQPSTFNQGDIHILAPITGRSVGIGHGGNISASNINQGMSLSLDRAALKASLLELFAELGRAGLSMQVQMEAQTATGLAVQQVEAPTFQVAVLARHLQHVGQSLQQAKVPVGDGSRLATAVMRLASLFGPVVGGAQVVASWFGIHQH